MYFRAIQGHTGGNMIAPESDESRRDSVQVERICTPYRLFFQRRVYPWNRTHCGWTREKPSSSHIVEVKYVRFVRGEKWRNTQPRTHKNVWFFSSQDWYWQDQSVWLCEYKECPNDFLSSLGAHWSDLLKVHNTMALSPINARNHWKSRQNVMPVTQTREGIQMSQVTSENQVAVVAKWVVSDKQTLFSSPWMPLFTWKMWMTSLPGEMWLPCSVFVLLICPNQPTSN